MSYLEYDNRCIWFNIFVCPDVRSYLDIKRCEGCKNYISVESPEGKAIADRYYGDIRDATDPVKKKWRKVMDSERMMRENV